MVRGGDSQNQKSGRLDCRYVRASTWWHCWWQLSIGLTAPALKLIETRVTKAVAAQGQIEKSSRQSGFSGSCSNSLIVLSSAVRSGPPPSSFAAKSIVCTTTTLTATQRYLSSQRRFST